MKLANNLAIPFLATKPKIKWKAQILFKNIEAKIATGDFAKEGFFPV